MSKRKSKGKTSKKASQERPITSKERDSLHRTRIGLNRLELLVCLLLIAATLTVYWQVRNHDFINFDDNQYITDNIHVHTGLRSDNITWAFTSTHAANWHPLTWLSHMLDCQLFGLNPTGHHLTSVFFHLVNSLLLFLILRWMTGTLWRSGIVAALFALHPLHVESVTWVAERKDVLSTLFWMLTLWAYLAYTKRPGLKTYFLLLIAFALGLMAKPMLVTLPFVLLLLDYWPLKRIELGQSGIGLPAASQTSTSAKKPWAQVFPLLLEKTPLFVLAAVSSVVTYIVQKSGGAVGALQAYPFKIRMANALLSYAIYMGKMIWPQNLAVFYPHPEQSLPMWQAAGAGLLLLVISISVIRLGRRHPYLPVGWLWYVGTLVPVIGLVQVGAQGMADRYTYVPLIGLFFIIAWGVTDLLGSWRYGRPALTVAATSLLSALIVCSSFQASHWKNSLTLFDHTLRATSNNWLIHNNLGVVLEKQGRLKEGTDHLYEALRIKPDYAEAHNNLALRLAKQGRLEEAIHHFSEAVRIKPDYAEAHNNLALRLAKQGKLEEAIDHFSEAVRIKPDYVDALNSLGVALAKQGKLEEAIDHFSEALRIKPDYAKARRNLRRVTQLIGKSPDL